MNLRELSRYSKIKNEIRNLEERIETLSNSILSSSTIDGMPLNISYSASKVESLAEKLIYLKEMLERKKLELYQEMIEIEDYLDNVEDNEIRVIIRSKYIDNKTWEEVGREIHCDRSTAYYKLKRYLKERKLWLEDSE